ncbi:FtsX-like permease family protein [Sphingomonas lenta]|uniref:ABC transporter permease n=1 Tax=Sphingomonas lenta TaxID=1141887 RepID=A0A2A2SGF2_9SPHN|nr:FtsX-like permease family protein [Sphingomonas lenta]PAX08283.1 ABC transporter permease [Sphingomonas lenta]
MWRNYLLVGMRALAKSRAYAAINIVGLALGLAACVMILLYVRYETSYDDWMEGADNAFQVQTYYSATETGGEEMKLQMSGIVTGRALKKDYPAQVEEVVWVRGFGPIVIQDGQAGEIEDLRMVDGDLFRIFRVPFVRGSREAALPDTNSIALSESEAKRRFGNADPIGKTLTIVDNTGNIDYRVTGVFKDFPKNSHFTANAVARFDLGVQFADRLDATTDWDNQQGWNYVRLRSPADADLIHANMPAWEKRNIPDTNVGGQRSNPGEVQDYRLVNVRDVHLGEAQDASVTPGNDRFTVATFAVIALLVLGMACVNFTNLATARASQRAREVALRKVLGASRKQLITQFLGESLLVAALAMVVALAAVELLLPTFNAFLDADIALDYFGANGVLLPLVALVLLVGVLAGLYPAFYLARFEPAKILKANKSAADAQGSGRLRNVLVVGQFAVSIALIICTAIIYAQTVYARTVDAGYKRDGLLQVGNLGFRGVEPGMDQAVTEQIRRIPGVRSAARTQIAVNPGNNSMTSIYPPNSTQGQEIGNYSVEAGFFDTMGMRIVAGRDFSEAQGRDDRTVPFPSTEEEREAAVRAIVQRGLNVVLTREAARRLGYRDPAAAVGQNLRASIFSSEEYGLTPITVVGVVEDARFRSIRDPLQPIVYTMRRNGFGDIMVRFSGDPNAIRSQVEQVWKRNVAQVPFGAEFADDIVREQYDRDEARGQLFAAFAVLAVVIGCLGLFGLAAFTAERRTKEIGIRKVLGARTRDIVRLLVWQFSRPVLVANLIAWPLAWWLMRDWLNGFDNRIELTPTPFVVAGLLALVIAIVTVGGHAYRVAQTSPVRALRYE